MPKRVSDEDRIVRSFEEEDLGKAQVPVQRGQGDRFGRRAPAKKVAARPERAKAEAAEADVPF